MSYGAAISACENPMRWQHALALLEDAREDLGILRLGMVDLEKWHGKIWEDDFFVVVFSWCLLGLRSRSVQVSFSNSKPCKCVRSPVPSFFLWLVSHSDRTQGMNSFSVQSSVHVRKAAAGNGRFCFSRSRNAP